MTLETWGWVTDRNIPIQGVNFTFNPTFESVSNNFRRKEAPFNFFPLTYNGDVVKLT